MEKFADKFGEYVVLQHKFVCYRSRSIHFDTIKEIRSKNNRLVINHFKTNSTVPQMTIFFEDKEKADEFHMCLMKSISQSK